MKIYKLILVTLCLGCNDYSSFYDTSSGVDIIGSCPNEPALIPQFSIENREPMILKFRNTNFHQHPPHLEFYTK